MNTAEHLITQNLDLWTSAIKRKSAAGRGSSKKIELYGIKKLRELILELAVRGLLVPQDSKDEPASELLKKITVERAELLKKGKIKKEKPLQPIGDEEKPFVLQKGWIWCRLTDLAFSQAGFAFKSNNFNESGEGLPLIRIRDVGQLFSGTYYGGEFREEFVVKTGDYLISMDGNFRVAPWLNNDALLNQRVSRLIFHNEQVAKRFVAEALQIRLLELQGIKAYTTVDHLSGGQISATVIALPPLFEQHRIVAKIDELMALCDLLEQQTEASLGAHQTLVDNLLGVLTTAADHAQFTSAWQRIATHFDTLFTTEYSIDQLKQALLQLAVMGRLVPQALNDEPASELLKEIATEKAKLMKAGKIRKEKPLRPIEDEVKPFELPNGWAWARFPELGEFGRGKSKHRPRNDPKLFNPGIYPLVQTGEVARANNVIYEYHSKYSEFGVAQSKIWPSGTLCITIAANIADSALLGFDACFPDSVVGFIPYKPLNDANYFLTFMKTARENLIKFAPATAQKNINLEILESVLIPIPPRNEITKISSKIDELMALCDQLKARLNDAKTTQLHLADAMAEKALTS